MMNFDWLKQFRWLFVFGLSLCLLPACAQADTISVGSLSFDTFIPASSGSPGIDAFNVSNLTGIFGLPPDFPVSDSLTFQAATLTLHLIGSGQEIFHLGDIAPGFLLDSSGGPIVQASSSQGFSAAEFTAILSTSVFRLRNGTIFTAGSNAIDILLLPSRGASLTADFDQATIDVAGSSTTTPEPVTWQVTPLGLVWLLRRFRRSIS